MIKQQNIQKIAELTKKSLQTIAKRVFAGQIIHSLNNHILTNEQSRSETLKESKDNQEVNMNVQYYPSAKNSEEYKFNQQTINGKQNSAVKIQKLCFGDYVTIETDILKEECRVYSQLNVLRLINNEEIVSSIINTRKSVFQICYPLENVDMKGELISSGIMLCLKNVFSGHYIHYTKEIIPSLALHYKITLRPQIQKSSIFKLIQQINDFIISDEKLTIESYYSNIKLSFNEQSLDKKLQRQITGAYSSPQFRITKYKLSQNLFLQPYYYIRCLGFDGGLEMQEQTLDKVTNRKSVRKFQLYDNELKQDQNEHIIGKEPSMIVDHLYELNFMKDISSTRINHQSNMSLCQIWQLQRTKVSTGSMVESKIKNIITNQSMEVSQGNDTLIRFKKTNVMKLKRADRNVYTVYDEENRRLVGVYEPETQRYKLQFQPYESEQAESIISNILQYKFQFIPIEPQHQALIFQLLEYNDILKINYQIILKWGFKYEERLQSIKYSWSGLKHKESLVRLKIKEIQFIFERIEYLITRQDKFKIIIQNFIKQMKMLDILVLYCHVLFIKIGKQGKEKAYLLARKYLQKTLLKIFDLIYNIILNNKQCSLVIIQNHYIFNELLSQYIEPVGLIINQSIKNLCNLTNKLTQEDDVIFSWTNHVQQIKEITEIELQKVYIDIICEVIVDPNDNGIYLYQIKIKEQLIGHRKKKILPKFKLEVNNKAELKFDFSKGQVNKGNLLGKPETTAKIISNNKLQVRNVNKLYVLFQYPNFPIGCSDSEESKKSSHISSFELQENFRNNKNKSEYNSQIQYFGSILKLIRNLCKDKNKKNTKIMQDYGLTIEYMHEIFHKHDQLSWEFTAKFIDIYCAMYLIQDPFLSFQKKEIKCHVSYYIKKIDFTIKTSMIFNQYTQETLASDKLKTFDHHLLPIITKYFDAINNIKQLKIDQEQINAFLIFLGILYEIISYGYLDYFTIQKYMLSILKNSKLFVDKAGRNELKQKIITKLINLIDLVQEISQIIHGMSLLRNIYNNLIDEKDQSITQLQETFIRVIEYDHRNIQQSSRKQSRNTQKLKTEQNIEKYTQYRIQNFNQLLIEYMLKALVSAKTSLSSFCLSKVVDILQKINKRGFKLCEYIRQILILTDLQEQTLYIQFSGRIPKSAPSTVNPERKLLNIMKVEELVHKIIEQNNEIEAEYHKKQKILQLKNLLIKIIKYLEQIYNTNNKLFKLCQILFRKLSLHTFLIEIMKKYEHQEEYEGLVEFIIKFYIEFMRDNQENITIISKYYAYFIRKYRDSKLPYFISLIFPKIQDKVAAFWQIYKNIDKKMQDRNKQILFETIYIILKICPSQILNEIKGQIIYTLISNNLLKAYLVSKTNQEVYAHFIKIVCLIGKDSNELRSKVSQIINKYEIIAVLIEKSQKTINNYVNKLVSLKLYYYLYIQKQTQVDEIQLNVLIQKLVLYQLKRFPPTCHNRAISEFKKANTFALSDSKNNRKDLSNEQLQKITKQYSNLMLEGGSPVHISQQENFFIYLLNIEDQHDITLLSFLQKLLLKYHVKNLQELETYLFRLLNFLQKIFTKQQKNYQSRIFNKLYEIAEVLQKKYNIIYKSNLILSYKQSYAKAEQFLKKLSEIIEKQKISYKNILRCFNISQKQIQLYKRQEKYQKLIFEEQFIKNLYKLLSFINNKQQFNKLIQDNNIKQFYRSFQERNKYKINILKFSCKVLELLEFQKNKLLVEKFNFIKNQYYFVNKQKNGENNLLETSKPFKKQKISKNYHQLQAQNQSSFISETINCNLVYKQFQSIGCIFEDTLSSYMQQKLQKITQKLLQLQNEKNMIKDDELIACKRRIYKNLIEINIAHPQFKILYKMINRILLVPQNIALLQEINCTEYLTSILNNLQEHANQAIIMIIKNIYQNMSSNKKYLQEFIILLQKILQRIFNLISEHKIKDIQHIYDSLLKLILNIVEKEQKTLNGKNIEQKMSTQLILSFEQFAKNGTFYWFTITDVLIQNIKNIKEYKILPVTLSSSPSLRNTFAAIINKIISQNLFNTNLKHQIQYKQCNLMLSLIKHLKTKGYNSQVYAIIAQWPFRSIFQTYIYNYQAFIHPKLRNGKYCAKQETCSPQYCNSNQMTGFDLEIYEFLLNILIVIKIGSQIWQENRLKDEISQSQAQMFLNDIYKLKVQTRDSKNGDINLKHFQHIRKMLVLINNKEINEIYFSIPTNVKYKEQIQKQVNLILPHVSMEMYYQNLYKLSIFIDDKFTKIQSQDMITLIEYEIKSRPIINYVILVYLFFICANLSISFVHISTPLLIVINSFFLIYNSLLFAFKIKKIYQYRQLQIKSHSNQIEYMLVINTLLAFLRIVSYMVQFQIESFYAITLILQITKYGMAEKIMYCIIKSMKYICYSFVYAHSIGLIFALKTDLGKYPEKYSNKLHYYKEFVKEFILSTYIPIISQDDTFKVLSWAHPMELFVYQLILIVCTAVFMAKIIIQLKKILMKQQNKGQSCQFCHVSQSAMEQKGLSFTYHIRYEHNKWNYIYFFMFMRKNQKRLDEHDSIKTLIESQNFTFLQI